MDCTDNKKWNSVTRRVFGHKYLYAGLGRWKMAFLFLDGFPNHCLLAGIISLFMLEPAFLLLFFFLSFYLTARIYSCNCSTQYLWNSCVIPALFLGRLRHRTLGEFHLKDKLNRNRVQKAHLYYSLSFKVNGTVVNCHLQQAYIQFVLCVCLYRSLSVYFGVLYASSTSEC